MLDILATVLMKDLENTIPTIKDLPEIQVTGKSHIMKRSTPKQRLMLEKNKSKTGNPANE